MHTPEGVRGPDGLTYSRRVRAARSDAELVDAFLTHVRDGEGATEREAELIRDVDRRALARGGDRVRLHRLELEGFGPFRERQIVDFDAFAADGIFLIAGRTGAGKSSVLDGVCFALYGGVPRYDGVEKRLRSDHCAPDDPTSVTVEFSAAGRRWRVTRSPEYERPEAARRGPDDRAAPRAARRARRRRVGRPRGAARRRRRASSTRSSGSTSSSSCR